MNGKMDGGLGCAVVLVWAAFGLVQVVAGWIGIERSFGWGWSLAALILAIPLRFTLPLVIGAFLCAKNVWGWHWVFALLFAAPGLIFMVPGFIAGLFNSATRARS